MRPIEYSTETLSKLLRRQRIATMPELMLALGSARRTVFRKLKELGYHTSYSHRGCYYALVRVAEFNELGLWSCKGAWFSVHGTLLATVAALVDCADRGHFVHELDNLLHVGTKDALRRLVADERLTRSQLDGQFLYCATGSRRKRQQLLARRTMLAEPEVAGPLPEEAVMPDDLKAAIVLFFSMLDEKMRRLYAGLEALKTGRGGDARIANLLGLDAGTVARGRQELLVQDVQLDRVRKAGGGRKGVEKKRRRSSRRSKS